MCRYHKQAFTPVNHTTVTWEKKAILISQRELLWHHRLVYTVSPMSPMEDSGGTAIQSYRADIQWVKGKGGKAILIKTRALGKWHESVLLPPGMPFFLQEEFFPLETWSLLTLDVYVHVGDTYFHLVYEPPCGSDLVPCLSQRQTLGRMTEHEIYNHNDNK